MQKLLGPKIVILLSIILCLFVTTNIHWGKDKWQNIIEADARGYYAYLPATFIYQDLNFTFYDTIEKKKYNTPFNYEYRTVLQNGKAVNKYFCGTAVAQLPFFLSAHLISIISGQEADGYSRVYMLAITLAGLCYLFIGLWFMNKLLKLYNTKDQIRGITIIAILFGTNLFFYSVCEMGMSHIYSFAFISMFCYFLKKQFIKPEIRSIIISMLLLGIIFLIRPANLLILVAVPFLAGDYYPFFTSLNTVKKNLPAFIVGIISMLLIMFIQPLIYKISTGSFWVDSYPGEYFDCGNPHFFSILFSYKKGLFLYTPLYLIALGGLWFLYKKKKFEFYSFIFFFCTITYVLSSWWNWWYGGSFSGRVFVDYLTLFALILSILLQKSSRAIRRLVLIPLIVLLIGLCQFQTYQYRYYLIHWEDMTQERYWDDFLKLKK
ncbi:MAG: hypothetical protein K0Q95_653 [Bacteroidota bacterium]|jgi:hypothetical protein|nr:hypothetical protein [Bacteroidota bacterium]